MRFFILFTLFILTCNAFSADKIYPTIIVDQVTSIYDGDTFRVDIKNYPAIIGERIAIRVNGIDTPEMKGKCQKEKDLARLAKQETVSLLRTAKLIELRNPQRGKYFRIVADVFADDKSLGKHLIDKQLAVPYDGGTKIKNWCE